MAAALMMVLAAVPAAVAQELSVDAVDRAIPDAIIDRIDFTSSVAIGLTYTDNVDFEQDARSDLFVFIRPEAGLRLVGRRANLAVDYGFEAGYSTDEGGFDIRQLVDTNLRSANTFELVDNLLFFDFNAALSREIVDNQIGTSGRDFDDENRALVQRYLASPFVVYRFGQFATNETRLAAGYVRSGDSADGTGEDDSITLEARTDFLSGSDFTNVLWAFTTFYRITDFDAADELKEFSTVLSTEMPIVRQFSLLANIGYDDVDRESGSELDGVRWDLGFTARPSRTFSLTFTGGQRYGEPNFFGEVSYAISPVSVFRANFNRTFDTEDTLFLEDLSFLGVDPQGQLIDVRTGDPFVTDTESFGITDRTFLRDRFNATLDLTRRRNFYGFSAFWEQREFLDPPEDTETSYGGRATWSRRLTRRTNSNLGFEYRVIDFGEEDDGREDTRYTVRASLSHALGDGFSLSGNYLYRVQQSTLDSEDGISENAVTISLIKTF